MGNIHGYNAISVRQEFGKVLLLLNGKLICEMPAEVAKQVATALIQKAARAEEWANPEILIKDQAIIDRLGIPLRIISDDTLRAEAIKVSETDPELRKYINGEDAKGPPGEILGLPSVISSPENHDEPKRS